MDVFSEINKKHLGMAFLALLVILVIFVAVKTVNEIKENRFIGGGVVPQNTITVTGSGEVFAIPDMATFTFGIVEEADTVSEAQELVTERVNEAVDFLKDSGIKEKDIQTQNFSVYPRYEYRREQVVCITFPCPQPPGERMLVGYEVSANIKLTLRDIDEAGNVLAGLGELEVSNLNGPNFSIEDEDEVLREARKEAIDEAKEKAKELARDLGVRLVRIVYFSESGPYGVGAKFFTESVMGIGGGADSALPAPDIMPGENRITSDVSITYEVR